MTFYPSIHWLSDATRGIDRFLFEPRNQTPLKAMRIAFGLFLIAYFSSLHSPAMMLYGTDGLVSRGGKYPLNQVDRPQLFELLSDHSDEVVWLVICGGISSGLWLMSGLLTRIAPLVAWLFVSSVVTVIPGNSGDMLVMCFATYMTVAGLAGHLTAGRRNALRSPSASPVHEQHQKTNLKKATAVPYSQQSPKPRRGRYRLLTVLFTGGEQMVPAWSIRLFQMQLVYVYFFSGYHKISNDTWYHGTALHYIAGQTFWSRFDLSRFSDLPPVTSLMTTAVLLFELLAFPVLVWIKPWRIPILFAGVVFHVTIYFTMKVFVFHQIIILYYMAFLLPADWESFSALFNPLQKFLIRFGWRAGAT